MPEPPVAPITAGPESSRPRGRDSGETRVLSADEAYGDEGGEPGTVVPPPGAGSLCEPLPPGRVLSIG